MVIPTIDLTLVPLGRRDLIMSKSAAKSWLIITATQAEYKHLSFSDFSAAIFDLQLNGTVCKIADTTIKKFGPENMEVAARISFLCALELGYPGGKLPHPQLHNSYVKRELQ